MNGARLGIALNERRQEIRELAEPGQDRRPYRWQRGGFAAWMDANREAFGGVVGLGRMAEQREPQRIIGKEQLFEPGDAAVAVSTVGAWPRTIAP